MGNSSDFQRIFETIASEACQALFSGYGAVLEPSEADEDTRLLYCGIIGFSGKQCRGTIVLGATEEILVRSHPLRQGPGRDWIAELANQLMGRIKNRILAHGVEVFISTPLVLRGEKMSPIPTAEMRPLTFAGGNGLVCVWTETDLEDGFVMRTTPDEAQAGIPEGWTLLF